MSRRIRLTAAVIFVVAFAASPLRAEQLVFSGELGFVVPEQMSRQMLQVAARQHWVHFPAHTRWIDEDGDGGHDFIAVALGAAGGYGAQLRYRVAQDQNHRGSRMGRWYWCVLTGPDGESLVEAYNR
ncbi:MAG: hypothetical protein DRQ37_04710 [Gammaproteobacteria bacterium]|nr:MAG: hypothetical protein DRQ37_04710 [Gammaproteobacteria bacterium]